MGFSQIAAFTILASSTLVFAGTMMGQIFNAQSEWNDAWLEAEDRVTAGRHADITLESGLYSEGGGGSTVTLTLTNSGSTTLLVSQLTYMVGAYYFGANKLDTAPLVDGVAADVWPPGSTLVVELDTSVEFPQAGGPNNDATMAVVTDLYGTQAFWRSA